MVEKKIERKLEKGIGFLGRFVERLIGQAKKAKVTYETRSALQPILSLEGRLPLPKIRSLIDFVGDRFINQALPPLKEKTVLEIGEGPLRFQKMIADKKPKAMSGIFVDGTMPQSMMGNIPNLYLKGSFRAIPFEGNFFDCVVARLATPEQGDVISAMKEIGRVLAPGGMGLILDFHPFGLYTKAGTPRLRSAQATIRGLEDYYKMCRVAGLGITDLHEGFIDDLLRNQFTTAEELNAFREIKGTPLVLFLVVARQGTSGGRQVGVS